MLLFARDERASTFKLTADNIFCPLAWPRLARLRHAATGPEVAITREEN